MKIRVKKGLYLFPVRDAVDKDNVTLIPVSKAFYQTFYREICRKRKKMQRNGECVCPLKKLWKCDGNCEYCRYYSIKQEELCLDAPIADTEGILLLDTIASEYWLPEKIAEDKELFDALRFELSILGAKAYRALELTSKFSEREAAKLMGVPRSSFRRYLAKIKSQLTEKLNEYR